MKESGYPAVLNYDRFPKKQIALPGEQAVQGWEQISTQLLQSSLGHEKFVITVECYPGVRVEEILAGLAPLSPALVILAEDCALSVKELTEAWEYQLTEDRVFGRMTTAELSDYFPEERLKQARAALDEVKTGICMVIGTGASLITQGDQLVYCELSRWEIQLRWRKGASNWHCDNSGDPQLSKYKRGFFIEWRLADRLKHTLLSSFDFVVDTNKDNAPVMISGRLFRHALDRFAKEPFRTVPYFDPGPWGGQWMKSVFSLDSDQTNYAWSFDGVPEENSLLIDVGGTTVELQAMNLVLYAPEPLLGSAVYGRFGAEFPIRFDLLDTMEGGNLSLQVHPLTSYIQQKFGMHYTQDESYYLLDCEEDACVYLGVRTGTKAEELLLALRESEETGCFDAERYINRFPVKKHDHVLIPAGTIHCSGKNAMVLEVSATPYIFTFKLYDWGRLGMDGRPRPIHLSHGERVIQWERDTAWVEKNLLHQEEVLSEEPGYRKERTGLHSLEFIETTRHWFDREISLKTEGSVNMLNLVEGAEVMVESPEDAFTPFCVHYAETFIIPEAVKAYRLRPVGLSEGKRIGVLRAHVRTGVRQ